MYRLIINFGLITLIGLVGLTGCEQNEDATGVTEDEIIIGSWGPLTGPAALWGNVVRGMDVYFDIVNEEGGIHGRTINFVYRDDGYEPPKTISAVRQMVQNDGVFAFVGGVGTATGMAVKQYITDHNIPWISPATGSTQFAYPPTKNIFATYPLYAQEAAIQVNYALDSLDTEKIAIIYQNDDYGKGGLIGAEMALEARGMELVTEVSAEIMDSDLNSQAALLKESGADVVLMWLLPRQAAIIKGSTGIMGYNPTWIAASTLSDMNLMHEITEGAWEGVIFSIFAEMPTNVDNEIMQKYSMAFKEKYPDARWGTFAGSGFVFAEPLVEALRRAGPNLTRQSLIEALESFDGWRGIGPKLTFGPNQRQGASSAYLVRSLGPDEYEVLTDYMDGGLDIDEVIARMN